MPQHPELPHSIFRAESTTDSAFLLLDTLPSQCTSGEGQNARMNVLEEFLERTWAPSLGELAQVVGQVLCRGSLIVGGEAGGVRLQGDDSFRRNCIHVSDRRRGRLRLVAGDAEREIGVIVVVVCLSLDWKS
jgi:hypothetical protein